MTVFSLIPFGTELGVALYICTEDSSSVRSKASSAMDVPFANRDNFYYTSCINNIYI